MCMVCKKTYKEGNLPILNYDGFKGDGCCTIGSLIELGKGIKQQIEEADIKDYYDLPLSIEEFTKMVEELFKKANNEKPNNARAKRSNNRT